jgi:hypothetical protein
MLAFDRSAGGHSVVNIRPRWLLKAQAEIELKVKNQQNTVSKGCWKREELLQNLMNPNLSGWE